MIKNKEIYSEKQEIVMSIQNNVVKTEKKDLGIKSL